MKTVVHEVGPAKPVEGAATRHYVFGSHFFPILHTIV